MGRHRVTAAPPAGPVSGPPGPGTDPTRPGRGSTIALVAVFLTIALASASAFVTVPYAVLKPGPITDVLGNGDNGKPLISVSGAPTYPTGGRLDFTTVRVTGGPGNKATLLDLLVAAVRSSEAIYPEDEIFPKNATAKDIEEENTAEMKDSQQEAAAVALRSLGKPVTETPLVAALAPDSPSQGKLEAGDAFVSIDGTRTTTMAAVRSAIAKHRAGEVVEVSVLRDGKPVTVSVTTKDTGGRAAIGVFLDVRFGFPFTVTIDAGSVGGPSAGMMFTLGLYDVLTPGELTGGADIAGTGTIDSTGAVGPIGGIQQKLVGAREGGARWFLAPADNCTEVVGHVPDGLRVVKVATFDDALRSVRAIAAKQAGSLPGCG